jgi:hypothetical protein
VSKDVRPQQDSIVPSGYACATPAAKIDAVDRLFAAHAAILAQHRAKAVADSP